MKEEQCYGVIPVIKDKEYKFLILLHTGLENNWSFPKGHVEDGETAIQTALRELEEETGIKDVEILDLPILNEEYSIIRNGERKLKKNGYFIGFVKDVNVSIQEGEIQESKWLTYGEAMKEITYRERREVLKQAKDYLEEYERRK